MRIAVFGTWIPSCLGWGIGKGPSTRCCFPVWGLWPHIRITDILEERIKAGNPAGNKSPPECQIWSIVQFCFENFTWGLLVCWKKPGSNESGQDSTHKRGICPVHGGIWYPWIDPWLAFTNQGSCRNSRKSLSLPLWSKWDQEVSVWYLSYTWYLDWDTGIKGCGSGR